MQKTIKTLSDPKYNNLMQKDKHDYLVNLVISGEYKELSDDDLIKTYKSAKEAQQFFSMLQLVVKLLCNSVYGGFGTASLRYFLQAVASDITAEGRNVCQIVDKMANKYFSDRWSTDTKWFNELKENFSDIIPAHVVAPKPTTGDICVYSDTDSTISSTQIRTTEGTKTIEKLFNDSKYSHIDDRGNEFATPSVDILNYTNKNKVYYGKVKHVIRHRVTKAKWKLKTKSGKEVIITNDHSMVVFRDGVQHVVKPAEILKTDKILVINEK